MSPSATRPLSWLDFFTTPKDGTPCLGVVLGRRSLWAAQVRMKGPAVEWEGTQAVPLEKELFTGAPTAETIAGLSGSLAPLFEKWKGRFFSLRVALPDPAVKCEVFELEKKPAGPKAVREFLQWRFKTPSRAPAGDSRFTSQDLGRAGDKNLLLGIAADGLWLDALGRAFREAGGIPSSLDMALCHRLNFFKGSLDGQGEGSALLTFEPDYWSLALLDAQGRPRLARAKWWEGEMKDWRKAPLPETMAEVERTVRSYVSLAPHREVGTLFITAPHPWLGPLVEHLRKSTAGGCVALDPAGTVRMGEGVPPLSSPSLLATAVRQ